MSSYWVRHRLLFTVIWCVVVAAIASTLFAFPYINQRANEYNSQSIFKNSDMDFIVPEPSFEQVNELPGQYGIEKLFPYYLTKTQVSVNGKTRTTTVLLGDQKHNVNLTMYNENRLIEKSDTKFDNSVLVDWQFAHDMDVNIGDTISLSIAGNVAEYRIYAVYETNSEYDGGAILAFMSDEQQKAIQESSKNSGYSGMYVSASDYNACRTFLTTEYRPMGRLKNRNLFENDEQYQIHYDAVMSSGYANEITDYRVRENGLDTKTSPIMIYIGAVLVAVLMIGFNMFMRKRGCEKNYFTKHCLPKGQNVKAYYRLSSLFETVLVLICYVGMIFVKINFSYEFISKNVLDGMLLLVPVTALVVGFVNQMMNYSMITEISKKVRPKQ